MERLTFEGNFCDIAQCLETPGGSFCEDGACTQRKVWERLKEYEDAEEANVESVKHGKWKWKTEDIYMCSQCGEKSHVKEVMYAPVWDFCPNCGARMDEGGSASIDHPG